MLRNLLQDVYKAGNADHWAADMIAGETMKVHSSFESTLTVLITSLNNATDRNVIDFYREKIDELLLEA